MGKGVEFYQSVVKPVHPTNVNTHGLFGIEYVKQHMMTADGFWTPGSITDEFLKMTDLLRKRLQFSNLEKVSQRKRLFHHYRVLKRQIRNGRRKWVKMISEDDSLEVRNLLTGNKGMQRLYQTMSLNQIVDNINQRTFTLRKERDRLTARLENLKADYEKALRAKSDIENRNRYHDLYVLDEQFKSYEKKKLLVNSQTRLAAIKTINGSYQKIIAILRYDEIFYEPILNSLDKDILDQEHFIKHILHLGSPAIARFSELSEDFRKQQEMARKRTLAMTELVTKLRSSNKRSSLFQTLRNVDGGHKGGSHKAAIKSPFVRETISMLVMKTELKAIEETIKKIKFATFCSKSTDIYQRMRGQVEYNYQLRKRLENDDLGLEALETKVKCASVLRDVLIDNITDEGDRRLKRVKLLGEAIEAQDKYQANILDYMKNRAKAFVLFRYSLWNIHDIMRHVAPSRGRPAPYPNEYLKLPLLKFEMLTMRAVPPEAFEENISSLMKTAEKKLRAVMLAFYQLKVKPNEVIRARADYQSDYIHRQELLVSETNSSWTKQEFIVAETAAKSTNNVPNRKQIKAQSAKLVEETAKRDE
ncbi:uncharacterized protein LOC119639277 [Glossina fuscipes]|uniref:Uncharacterized protein LOC119639277 n=1 Tax=Glossina fuscipes TaxID=7396 RepID=A0A9C5ZDS9_9MUSC|nr:uncharacterized protein LOC119639277 [Glossina fuscipes]KAI9579802.1 hypothetical protein GQX74_000590 [Glossina fuscipes]